MASVLACASLLANAVTLGPLSVESGLGQPLRAAIEITQYKVEDLRKLKIQLAEFASFEQAGMAFNPALNGLQARLEFRGDGKPYIALAGQIPVTDHFVDVIVEAQWPSGRLAMNYTLLVSPQTSIAVALVAVGVGAAIGTPLGLWAAARRGTLLDDVIMRLNDLVFAFPALLIAILITAVFGPGAINAIIAIGIFNIPVFARLARAGALSLWQREYIMAARVAGKGAARISAESFSVMARGVPAGAAHMCQGPKSKFGMPASAMVGTSGRAGKRSALVIASARTEPSRTWPSTPPVAAKNA